MARKPWSEEAKKAQSKRIKKMWANKKKYKIKEASATLKPVKEAYIMPPPVEPSEVKEPWEIARDEREAKRQTQVKALRKFLTQEQMNAALYAARVLQEFNMDYSDGYEIFDGTLPRRMLQAKEELAEAFSMTHAYGYKMPSYEAEDES
tara:strand:- start:9 stop:455 length:447 start_codon:yes stop_codon:yes gene_type:complete